MNREETIAHEGGFEIHRCGQEIIFINRKTFGVGLAGMILGGFALMAGAWSVLSTVFGYQGTFSRGPALIAAGILLVVFAIFSALAFLCFKAYRQRKNRSVDEVPDALIADLSRRVLLRRGGQDLCSFSEIKVKSSMDLLDHSRGLMRKIQLRWVGGNECVFKTNSCQEATRLQHFLEKNLHAD